MSKPSPTELSVLKVLWNKSPLSAREVHDEVKSDLQWTYSSTRKTLERMEEKGIVSSAQAHGIRIFKPKANKVRVFAEYIKDLGSRVLELDEPLPVSLFADSKLLDERDIRDLERLLKKMDRK